MPAPAAVPDATQEFAAKLNDPQRWVIKLGVPIFKAHERVDPNTGNLIKVDLAKLHRIAANIRRLEEHSGVPLRLTLGHTEPNKSEPEQPPVGGYYRNARVGPFGPKGEPAILVDEWLDPQYAPVRKNYPYRSSEYYDDAEQITGVALLTRDPFLDLGVVAYDRGDDLVCYTVQASGPDRRLDYARSQGRKPVLYHLVMGERAVPTDYGNWAGAAAGAVDGGIRGAKLGAGRGKYGQITGAAAGAVAGGLRGWNTPEERDEMSTPYGSWPGPAYKKTNLGHQHGGSFLYGQPGAPTNYNPALAAVAGGIGRQAAVSAAGHSIAGQLSGDEVMQNSRYANQGYGRGPAGRYAEEGPGGPPPGAGGPPGDPMQQLQMLLMAAVEVLGQITGGGGGPAGPPPGPPQSPIPPEAGEEYARYGRGYGPPRPYAAPTRPAGRGGYPRAQQRYQGDAVPTPYAAPQAPPAAPSSDPRDVRTISGRPLGESLELARLRNQLSQYSQVTKMLVYERDQADTAACQEAIQRLADQGYQVGEYEFAELKNKPLDQRGLYVQHIMTKYQKVGTEALPPLLGDPTPGPADSGLNGPATKEEMEAALKLVGNNTDPTAYNKALEQVRYARAGGTQYGVNRIAELPFAGGAQIPPAGIPQGPADAVPQYGEWAPAPSHGFNPANPYGEPVRNGTY